MTLWNQRRASLRGGVSFVLGLVLAATGVAEEIPKPEDWVIESQQASFAVGDAAVVELLQPVGDLRIEGADVDSVVVTMVIQRHRDDPCRAVIREDDPETESLELEFGFTDGEAALEPESATWNRRRIDVGVQVPLHLGLTAQTDAGLIELEDLAGSAELSTQTGEIHFEGAGGLQVRTYAGSIRAKVLSTQTDAPLTLESTNGNVWVLLLEGATASIEFETSGQVATDFSLDIQRERGSNLKKGRAKVGEGRRPLRLATVNGQVRLSVITVDEPSPVSSSANPR